MFFIVGSQVELSQMEYMWMIIYCPEHHRTLFYPLKHVLSLSLYAESLEIVVAFIYN